MAFSSSFAAAASAGMQTCNSAVSLVELDCREDFGNNFCLLFRRRNKIYL
jgi:hypothetical protein